MEKNCFRILLLVALTSILAQTQTVGVFSGLPMNQTLINEGNQAVNNLKASLNSFLTCDNRLASFLRQIRRKLLNNQANQPEYQYEDPTIRLSAMFRGEQFIRQRAQALKASIEYTASVLDKIKLQFIAYNNVIVGASNAVTGDGNFIIGSSNNFWGNNNWAFTSNANSTNFMQGVLVIDRFIIELSQFLDQDKKLREVVHCLLSQRDSNDMFNRWWRTANPRSKIFI